MCVCVCIYECVYEYVFSYMCVLVLCVYVNYVIFVDNNIKPQTKSFNTNRSIIVYSINMLRLGRILVLLIIEVEEGVEFQSSASSFRLCVCLMSCVEVFSLFIVLCFDVHPWMGLRRWRLKTSFMKLKAAGFNTTSHFSKEYSVWTQKDPALLMWRFAQESLCIFNLSLGI